MIKTINEIIDIENIKNEEIKALFIEANNYMNSDNVENYMKALLNYDKIIALAEKIGDYAIWPKAYFGLYLVWANYCKKNKLQERSSLLLHFIDFATSYAESFNQKELADKIWQVSEEYIEKEKE